MALGFGRGRQEATDVDDSTPAPAGDRMPAAAEDEPDTPAPKEPPRRFNKVVVTGVLVLLAAVAGSVIGARIFVQQEMNREVQAWQVRLGIVADSRVAAVDDWIAQNFKNLRDLSQNASLQIYVSQLAEASKKQAAPAAAGQAPAGTGNLPSVEGLPALPSTNPGVGNDLASSASVDYLRNLLIATAERTGFKAPPPVGEVKANIRRAGVAGLALIDENGDPVVSTPDMPPMNARMRAAVRRALDGQPAVVDLYIGASGEPTMGFVMPVYGIQQSHQAGGGAKGLGAVIGIRTVDRSLWDQLQQPGQLMKSAETYLVRKDKDKVDYLSPLADNTPSLKRTMALGSPNLLAPAAVAKPGGFFTDLLDYAGTPVLAVSRTVPQVPWVLIRKVSRAEALSATRNRLNVIMGVFIALITIVTLAILFVWKKGASARATRALHTAQVSLERFQNLTKFMQVVTNNQPTQIVAVDRNTTYSFANETAANAAGIPQDDFIGKTMAAVIGPVKAQDYAELVKRVIDDFERMQRVFEFGDPDILDPGAEGAYQVVKVDGIPLRGDRDYPPGCLLVIDDITELSLEKIKSERMMKELIDTLVSVVDRRDPFSGHHSTRVAEVSRAIAREMGLDELEVKTVDIAGSLMNLGKIFIPPEVLIKTNDLTEEERELLQHAYLTTVDLIEHVTFEGPVVETIRQFGETWDGSGPLGLKEDEIIVTARILSVANAFVGMISPRAYRGAMTFEQVADILMQDTATKFDRKPVTALVNFLENRGGKRRWAHFREDPTIDTAAE